MDVQSLIKIWIVLSFLPIKKVVIGVTCPVSGAHYSPLNYCYWFISTAKSYQDQEDECALHNGDLAIIPDTGSQQFIQTQFVSAIQATGQNVFTGFKKGYYWITDGPVHQTWFNWKSNEPRTLRFYVAIDPSDGFKWKSVSSINLLGSDPEYTALCYKEQKTACEGTGDGSTLGVIPDNSAQAFIESQLGSVMIADGQLVITGISLGSVWPSGWTNWDSVNGQPDGGSVAVLDPVSFRWRDESLSCGWGCSVEFPALCYGGDSSFLAEITTVQNEVTTYKTDLITTEVDTETTVAKLTTQNADETSSISDTTPEPLLSTNKDSTTKEIAQTTQNDNQYASTTTYNNQTLSTDSSNTLDTLAPLETTTDGSTTNVNTVDSIETTQKLFETSTQSKTSSEGYLVTTDLSPATTYSAGACMCKCTDLPPLVENGSINYVLLEQQIAKIVRKLKVDKKTTSNSIRKMTSADDKRASAKQVGGVGLAILVFVIGGIILLDLQNVIMFIRNLKFKNK